MNRIIQILKLFLLFICSMMFLCISGKHLIYLINCIFQYSQYIMYEIVYPNVGAYSIPVIFIITGLLFRKLYTILKYYILFLPIQYIIAHQLHIGGTLGEFFFTLLQKIAALPFFCQSC